MVTMLIVLLGAAVGFAGVWLIVERFEKGGA